MKTTFSYFWGMFENPAQAKYYLKKEKKLWNVIYECVEKNRLILFVN